MKIVILASWFPYPPDNGSKIRVYQLLKALALRHEVTLLSFAFGTAKPHEPGKLADWCKEIYFVHRNPSARSRLVRALHFLSPSPIVTWPVPEMRDLVRRTLDANTYDVVIASTESMAAYALMAPPNCIKILEEHNCLSRWMWERHETTDSTVQRARTWVSWQKTRLYEQRLFRRFDLVTMVSESDRQACFDMVGHKGSVEAVPNGVDCQSNTPDSVQKRQGALVYNGALTYSANYDAMRYFTSAIYPLIRQCVPDVSLTITGSTAGVPLSGLLLDESVNLSGYVEDIRPFVAGSTVCVVPLRQGGGSRLKILEAMALGTPLVATTKGAEGLDVVHDEHLLIADDPHSFAEATVLLLRDAGLRHRLAANARGLVEERYDWREIGARFVDLVEETVTRSQTQRDYDE